MELELSTFDVPSAPANAMTLVRERSLRHGDARAGRGSGPRRAGCRRTQFKQILVNLLSNAVKFTPDGGRIEVKARREKVNVVIAVHDTGIGTHRS